MLSPVHGKTFQVAIEVEREEDEGGMVGETFTDYVIILILLIRLCASIILAFTCMFWYLETRKNSLKILIFNILSTLSSVQRPPKLSIGPPHPDPVVETSSLSAVQPPEPTYDLTIKDDLENSKALSCLQIETLVYACQVCCQFIIWNQNFI